MQSVTWPESAAINGKGRLEIGGCDTIDLAKEFGTPLYVMDEQTIRDRCRQYRSAFKAGLVIFASKALCTVGISKIIASEGLGFDVSSGGELYTVLKAGADPKKIYFHGNNKSTREIKEGLEVGIGRFVVDNEQELTRLDKISKEVNRQAQILFRVNPGIEAHTHEFIQTGKIDSKFGVQLNQLDGLIKKLGKMPLLKLAGFHAHIGSQILEIKPFVEEAKILQELTSKYGTEEINIGGGLGIAYLPQHTPPTIAHLASEIHTNARLVVEPGRSIVGPAGVTLYTVGGSKEIPGVRKYLFIDGGMADNPRPILYQAKYEALLANKPQADKTETVTVAGRFCEAGDILLKDLKLPPAETGDILVVACTGAYNYAMASNYNRVGRPAMVLVNNGSASIVVRRESYEDLIANDSL